MDRKKYLIKLVLILLLNALVIGVATYFYISADLSEAENNWNTTWQYIFYSLFVLYILIPLISLGIHIYRLAPKKVGNIKRSINLLPWHGVIVILICSLIWTLWGAFPEAMAYEFSTFERISTYLSLTYIYIIFPSNILYMFFSSMRSSMIIELHHKLNITFEIGRGKIWLKLLQMALMISIFPTAILFSEILIYLMSGDPHIDKSIHFTTFTVLLATIVISVIVLTRDLNSSVRVLLKSFGKLKAGALDTRAPISSNEELGILTEQFNEMAEGLEERQKIKNAFGQYVSPEVAEEILSREQTLKGEERTVTVLFTDIENYTHLTEKLSPTETIDMLNQYYQCLITIVKEYGGTVNKFMGDALMVLFNAPQEDVNHALHGVMCGQEIISQTRDRKFGPGVLLKTRVGINTANVVAGRLGGQDRFEYTIMGDGVNLAQRLEQLNKKCRTELLFSRSTADQVQDQLPVKRVGTAKVKGKEEKQEIFTTEWE